MKRNPKSRLLTKYLSGRPADSAFLIIDLALLTLLLVFALNAAVELSDDATVNWMSTLMRASVPAIGLGTAVLCFLLLITLKFAARGLGGRLSINKTPVKRDFAFPGVRGKLILSLTAAGFLAVSLFLHRENLNQFFVEDDWRFLGYGRELCENFGPGIIADYIVNPRENMPDALRPIPYFSFGFDYGIWKLNPTGYHLTNITFHAMNGFLLFLLLLMLGGGFGMSMVSAVLFLFHPLQSEPVNWLTIREELIPFFFCHLSLVLFVHSLRYSSQRSRFASLFVACVALASKENSVILPAAVFFSSIVLDLESRKPGIAIKALKQSFPYALIVLIYFVLRYRMMGFFGRSGWENTFPLDTLEGWSMMLRALLFDMPRVLLLPVRADIWSDGMKLVDYSNAAALILFFAAAGLTVVSFRKTWEPRWILFAFAWIFVPILPTAQHLVPMDQLHHSRRFYFPSAGFAVILGYLLYNQYQARKWKRHLQRIFSIAATTGILAYFCICLAENNSYWRMFGEKHHSTFTFLEEFLSNLHHGEIKDVYFIGPAASYHGPFSFVLGFLDKPGYSYIPHRETALGYKVGEDLFYGGLEDRQSFDLEQVLKRKGNFILLLDIEGKSLVDGTSLLIEAVSGTVGDIHAPDSTLPVDLEFGNGVIPADGKLSLSIKEDVSPLLYPTLRIEGEGRAAFNGFTGYVSWKGSGGIPFHLPARIRFAASELTGGENSWTQIVRLKDHPAWILLDSVEQIALELHGDVEHIYIERISLLPASNRDQRSGRDYGDAEPVSDADWNLEKRIGRQGYSRQR